MKVQAQQHDTVDALCWRHLGRTQQVVEQTLEINPGLADYGLVLPHGLVVQLPQVTSVPAIKPITQLWD